MDGHKGFVMNFFSIDRCVYIKRNRRGPVRSSYFSNNFLSKFSGPLRRTDLKFILNGRMTGL